MRNLFFLALASALVAPGGAAQASEGEEGTLPFVSMDEVTVPIIDGARADGRLRFQLVLEAKDPATAQALTAAMPVLRAAAVSAGVEFARLYASPRTPVDARRLAAQMTAALQAQRPGIRRVLLVQVRATPA